MSEQEDVQLRAATEADEPAISACVNTAYQHYQTRLGRLPAPMTQDHRQSITDCEVVVAVCRAQILGVLVLRRSAEGYLLDNVAVLPAAQGTGIGRRLLEHAEGCAQAAGYDSIYLYTHVKMLENLALYTRIGYQEFDRRTEDGLSRVYLRKRLAELP